MSRVKISSAWVVWKKKKTEAICAWQLKLEGFWELQVTAMQSLVRDRIGDQDFPPNFFLPALKRLGWEDFTNWKIGSISRDVCFFLSSAQEARSYWGRNLALTEEGSKLGEEEREKSQRVGKVCFRKQEEIYAKTVLMEAKTGCWGGTGTYPPWPRLNSGPLNNKCSATPSQCLWKNNRSLFSYVSALLGDQFTWRSVKMMEGSSSFRYQTGF